MNDFTEINGRRYERAHLTPESLTFLYPAEIIARLEGLARACGIDAAEGNPLPATESKR